MRPFVSGRGARAGSNGCGGPISQGKEVDGCAKNRLGRDEIEARSSSRLLHERASRRKLGGDIRFAATIYDGCAGAGRSEPALRYWVAIERSGFTRISRAKNIAAVQRLAGGKQLLHFHDQRISLWPLSWHAC